VEAMLQAAEPLVAPDGAIDIVGTGGSMHRRQHALNVSTMASIVAVSAGATVCKHGNRRASSTSGSFDFLEALGLWVELSGEQLSECMSRTGVGFAYARTFHPAMRHAAAVRAELGIPTVFNLLGPLANPGRVKRYVLGTSTPEVAQKVAGALANLGSTRSWVVSGSGGIDELTVTGSSVVFEVTPSGVRQFELSPQDVGLSPARSLAELAGGSPQDNAEVFRRLLDGRLVGPKRDVVVLNAAAGLVVGGIAADLAQGVELASSAVEDGRAGQKLAELVTVTNQVASQGK
jgi:anthranilate phosphoribosyltransferase